MPLPTMSPRDAGLDAQGVLDLLDAASDLDLHSIAIARHGAVVARGWWAPYTSEQPQLVYSVSKSLTATTIATLLRDGLIDLDEPVVDLLDLDALDTPVAEIWRRVTVRHCLTMSIGHTADAWPPARPVGAEPLKPLLARPPDAEPGSVFCYNQVATYLLSRAAENRTGAPLDQLCHERVLAPLGIDQLLWDTDRAGHALGFSGARLRTDDLLNLTQLWLDGGARDGDQLLPPGWVHEAAQPYRPTDGPSLREDGRGYGQSFWTVPNGFHADGAFGQLGLVFPEHDLAIAITSELAEGQDIRALVDEHVLPAVDRPGSAHSDVELAQRLATLTIEPLRSTAQGHLMDMGASVTPTSDIKAITDVEVHDHVLTLIEAGERYDIPFGDGRWRSSTLTSGDLAMPVAASGGRTDDGAVIAVRFVQTPHSCTVTIGGGQAEVRWRQVPLSGGHLFARAHA